jgi:lysine-specific demethylase 8
MMRYNWPIVVDEHSDGRVEEHCQKGRPCVLRGAARDWPAMKWTPAHLRERFADVTVPVAALEEGRLVTGEHGLRMREMRMGEFSSGYLMAPLGRIPRALRDEVIEPEVCRGAGWRSSKLWWSPRGAVSPLHFDLAHNLHAQLHGQKRFLLFSPRDSRALYRCSLASPTPNFSAVDPEAPDLVRHPRFRLARPIECTLSPGDILFIPSRHWHHVRSESESISVNFWWARSALGLLVRAADWFKRKRSLSR